MASEVAIAQFEDKEVRKFLTNITKKLDDINGKKSKYVGLLSGIIFKDVISHFQDEKGPKGKWQKWSPTYQEYMESIGRGGNQILQWSGRMRQNFKPTDVKTTREGILWFNDAKTKTGFPYAAAHDNGEGKLPQREFMYLSDKGTDQVSVQTLQFLLDEGV